jgi:3-polyprenyl-4-hydroxybenzoate decarboxylase
MYNNLAVLHASFAFHDRQLVTFSCKTVVRIKKQCLYNLPKLIKRLATVTLAERRPLINVTIGMLENPLVAC